MQERTRLQFFCDSGGAAPTLISCGGAGRDGPGRFIAPNSPRGFTLLVGLRSILLARSSSGKRVESCSMSLVFY